MKSPRKKSETSSPEEAISHLRNSILSGKHWYLALLEAISLWTIPEEEVEGRRYKYLIAGEAFNWLLLAERLCREVEDLIPEEERANLLLCGYPPLDLSKEEFKEIVGPIKYQGILNYFYGVMVEQALLVAAENEVRKEWGFADCEDWVEEEAFRRVYGEEEEILRREFFKERGMPFREELSLSELEEFTYWLFRYRVREFQKERVASDTKKALRQLEIMRRGVEKLMRARGGRDEDTARAAVCEEGPLPEDPLSSRASGLGDDRSIS